MNKKFGEYTLSRLLGEGTSTEVFLAEHPSQGKVALKTTVKAFSEEWSASFLGGVRKAASLSHPNIAQIHDWGIVDGRVFSVSDYIIGRDLQKVAERGFDEGRFFPVPLAVSVIASIAGGLHYAHTRKDSNGAPMPIYHEDLCPQNVVVSADGNVKITDFSVGESLRKLSPVPGRLAYLSPEQIDIDYGPIDERTDVFSLGVLAYELVTCKRLFKGETDEDTYGKVLTLPIIPPHHVRTEIDVQLSNVIMKSLEREPTLRFQNIRDFQMGLVDWLSSQDSHTTDAHIAAYMGSLFPELEDEKVPEETNALVISASLFEQMDASSGVNFEKWAEEQSKGQLAEMTSETMIALKTKDLYGVDDGDTVITNMENLPPVGLTAPSSNLTDVGMPAAESEPQHTQDFLSSVVGKSVSGEFEAPKKKIPRISLADLPMPTLNPKSLTPTLSAPLPGPNSPDSFDGDFEVPATIVREPLPQIADSEALTTQFESDEDLLGAFAPDQSLAPTTSPYSNPPGQGESFLGNISPLSPTPDVEKRPVDMPNLEAQTSDPQVSTSTPKASQDAFLSAPPTQPMRADVVTHVQQEAPASISAEIQTVGPGGFRPPAFTPHGSPWTQPQPQVEMKQGHYDFQSSADEMSDIEDWKPTTNKRGVWVGLGFLAIILIFGGGLYLASNAENTLEKDVGGKKIDPSKIKELAVKPPPSSMSLGVSSTVENIHYIVNGKLQKTSNGSIPIYKGITNEVIAMAPGHAPKKEMVAGESTAAPIAFELTPMELELDSELQIVADPRGAAIKVDGMDVGVSPTTVKLSSRIEHHVEISADGRRPHAAFIGLIPGKDNLIDAKLESDKRSYIGVNFAALPRGSVIKLDDKAIGISPIFKKLKRNRIMRVDISQADSRPISRRIALVDVGSFDMRPFLPKISRKKGTISLKVIPKGADIYIGANGYGVGPIKKLKLREGKATVVIDSATGRIEKRIEVVPDKHLSYTIKITGSDAKVSHKVLKR